MVNLKLVSKIALFFGIASAAFTVILAILNVLIIQIASTGSAPVPTDYLVYYILTIDIPLSVHHGAFIHSCNLIKTLYTRNSTTRRNAEHNRNRLNPPSTQLFLFNFNI